MTEGDEHGPLDDAALGTVREEMEASPSDYTALEWTLLRTAEVNSAALSLSLDVLRKVGRALGGTAGEDET